MLCKLQIRDVRDWIIIWFGIVCAIMMIDWDSNVSPDEFVKIGG